MVMACRGPASAPHRGSPPYATLACGSRSDDALSRLRCIAAAILGESKVEGDAYITSRLATVAAVLMLGAASLSPLWFGR